MSRELPIVEHGCTLTPDDLAARLAEWEAIGRLALSRTDSGNAVRTAFPRRPEVVAELRRLAAAEASCCAHLAFSFREEGDVVELEIRAVPH